MCGLLYSTVDLQDQEFPRLDNRGPDYQHREYNHLGFFYHSNLGTRQNQLHQPLKNNVGVCLYNGTQYEISQND